MAIHHACKPDEGQRKYLSRSEGWCLLDNSSFAVENLPPEAELVIDPHSGSQTTRKKKSDDRRHYVTWNDRVSMGEAEDSPRVSS